MLAWRIWNQILCLIVSSTNIIQSLQGWRWKNSIKDSFYRQEIYAMWALRPDNNAKRSCYSWCSSWYFVSDSEGSRFKETWRRRADICMMRSTIAKDTGDKILETIQYSRVCASPRCYTKPPWRLSLGDSDGEDESGGFGVSSKKRRHGLRSLLIAMTLVKIPSCVPNSKSKLAATNTVTASNPITSTSVAGINVWASTSALLLAALAPGEAWTGLLQHHEYYHHQ